ncbi:putative F-box only protein 15 [Raphanus sativus]|uniref:F-box only protein 15 n=1 Tax=Raphanus sativus TaxID=3726 RepID=A0A6J0LE50_RAPSA|nr:putative F-box only protein 15 [Raphanus sativus]
MASFSTMPLDLTKEILYRTPAESLVRAKATCKQWNDLIKDKRFIYEHWRRSPERFLRADQTVQILDLVNRTRSDSPIPNELQLSISNVMAMIHCDGLMLCVWSDKEYFMFRNIALWNPLTRNFNVIEHRLARESHRFLMGDNFGIGYDVRGNYKILMFSANHYCKAVVEIYECMSKSWRTLVDSKVDWEAYPWDHGVSVVGNMYWLVKKKIINYILAFDFSVETFKEIWFCHHLPYDNNYLGCFDGDKLSLLHQNQDYPSPIEVWVSSKLDVGNVTFAKYFSVSSPYLPAFRYLTFWAHPVYCIAKHERIIAWYTMFSTCLILCEIDEGGVSNQFVTAQHYWDDCMGTFNCGYVYKPSLVPLP